MPKSRRANNRRELLLDAAESVAVRLGAAHLTLDAVARKARIAKGGLLYHFPGKEALLQALVQRALQRYGLVLQQALTDPTTRGDFALAHIRSLAAAEENLRQVATIIITVAATYPDLLRPLRESMLHRYAKILGPRHEGSRAIIAMLAINGLLLMEHLGVGPLSPKNRAQIIRQLQTLIEDGEMTRG
jgi:AcrR family transcriptional regulator